MWELEEEDEQFLKDFIAFLDKCHFLADGICWSENWNNAIIKTFVKDANDAWKREMKLKAKAQQNPSELFD